VRWSAALVIFVAVMAGTGYYVYTEVLRGGGHVEVPDVTMRPITEASFLLAEAQLEAGQQKEVVDDRIPRYYVIMQRPAAGKVVRTGRKVFLTVSAGSELLTPPDLTGKMLAGAEEEIKRSAFELGAVPRIPHESPRDTVLAQDPVPTRRVSSGARISLLVSDGRPRPAFIMPNLLGRPVQAVLQTLTPLGVKPIPQRVDMPGQHYDVVLDQQPAAGTLIREGDAVVYSVMPSGSVALPDAQHSSQKIVYTVPSSWFEREVRVDTIDRNGTRATYFPLERHYVNGKPPRFGSGYQIIVPSIRFIDHMSVEIWLDNHLAQEHFFEGGKDPVITEYNVH